ncbi:RNF220 isoform 12 [Pan troglodytes]|uniref:Ring finger protein 220 n=3 Tax=Hominidae TaxID=9604 RepID=U3KPZ6_HUMAN|nr:RNF220 isoform 12 [Pan troglodytes]PNJ21804.1 RNF220 isoform 14 [Pongo abelii]
MPRARSGRRSRGAGGREEVDLSASTSQPADPTECSDWENETEEAR